MIFVDTSAWFAYSVPTDHNHQRIFDWFASNRKQVVTTDYCVDETLTLLCARGEHRRALNAGREFLEKGNIRLQFITADQIRRAWILFQQRISTGWSFTDCTSKIVIDELRIQSAVALDDHFRQFGIQILP